MIMDERALIERELRAYIDRTFRKDELYQFIIGNKESYANFEIYSKGFFEEVKLNMDYTNLDVSRIFNIPPRKVRYFIGDVRLLTYISTTKVGKMYNHSVDAVFRIGLLAFALDKLNMSIFEIANKTKTQDFATRIDESRLNEQGINKQYFENYIQQNLGLIRAEIDMERRYSIYKDRLSDKKTEIAEKKLEISDLKSELRMIQIELSSIEKDIQLSKDSIEENSHHLEFYNAQVSLINNDIARLTKDAEGEDIEGDKVVIPAIQQKRLEPKSNFFKKLFFKEVGEDVDKQEIVIQKDNSRLLNVLELEKRDIELRLEKVAEKQLLLHEAINQKNVVVVELKAAQMEKQKEQEEKLAELSALESEKQLLLSENPKLTMMDPDEKDELSFLENVDDGDE